MPGTRIVWYAYSTFPLFVVRVDFSKFRFVSKSPQNANSGVNGVHLVDEVILVGALEAASGGND